MVMGRGDIETFLGPKRVAFLERAMRAGLADTVNPDHYSAWARQKHSTSLRSHIRNEHIVARAEEMAAEMPELAIRVVRRGNRAFLLIADRVRVSFKKLDKRLRPRGIRTRQATDFLGQRLLPEVDMVPATTNLVAGYKADATETQCELYLTCPSEQVNLWDWKLSGAEIVPIAPVAPAIEASTGKVRRRRASLREGVEGERGATESAG